MAAAKTSTQQQLAPKTRLGLSLAERIKVIEARKMGKSMRQLAAQFGCGKTQILNTLAQKERYTREWEVSGRNNPSIGARKRFRHTRNEQINKSVHSWYKEQVSNGLRITGPMLQRQARNYAAHFGIANFAASNGWLANFRRFYNIASYTSRLEKQSTDAGVSCNREEEGNPVASTSSAYNCNAEFIGCDDISNRTSSEGPSIPVLSEEKDPLEDNHGQQLVIGLQSHVEVKPEPADDDGLCYTAVDPHCFSQSLAHSFPPTQSSVPNNDYSSGRQPSLSFHSVCSWKANNNPTLCSTSPPVVMNHRKRRLLQVDRESPPSPRPTRPVSISEPVNAPDERRIPKLEPLTPLKVYLAEFVNLARSKGLTALLSRDDSGNEWVDIRQAIATFRVPYFGYPTHLSRLIVDSSLQYFIEVLGHCVQKGSLLCPSATNSLNYAEITSILCAVNGGHVVCAGIGDMSVQPSDLYMRTVQEIAYTENQYVTQPDNRCRSFECLMWIDRRMGPVCPACKTARSFGDKSVSPIDLRRMSSRRHQQS